jgi:hypothetical protein
MSLQRPVPASNLTLTKTTLTRFTRAQNGVAPISTSIFTVSTVLAAV